MGDKKTICPFKITEKTLIIRAGGGYDIYTCLPWYLSLTNMEKSQCMLANYSFTDDLYKYEKYENEWIVEITQQTNSTKKNSDYFPEKHLSQALNKSIYAIRLIPNPLLRNELDQFIRNKEIKQIILVDGGVDSCLYGDESLTGSPLEDSQTILACYEISQKMKLPCKLMCSALYVDEVSEDIFLKHWDKMIKKGFECEEIVLNKFNYPYELHKQIVNASPYASIIQ